MDKAKRFLYIGSVARKLLNDEKKLETTGIKLSPDVIEKIDSLSFSFGTLDSTT